MSEVALVISFISLVALTVGAYLGWHYYQEKRLDIDAIRQCEAVIKANSATFYKAFKAIPNAIQRQSVFAVYAFCRYADDLIDEHHDVAALNQLEVEITAFFDNPMKMAKTHWRWRALALAYRHFYAPSSTQPKEFLVPYLDMIRGQRMDLEKTRYQTLTELLDYCYCVASSVGLMLLPILAPKTHRELTDCAIHLGYAMQLTNILRDIGEDDRKGRIYIPQLLLQQAKLTEESVHNGIINQEFIGVFETLAKEAERYYGLARQKLPLFPRETQIPLALAALFYEAILNACREAKYDVFRKKNYVSDEIKNRLIKQYI